MGARRHPPRSPCRVLAIVATVQQRNRNGDLALRLDDEYDAPVRFGSAAIAPGTGDDESGLSVADRLQQLIGDALRDEIALHGLRTAARELQVVPRPARGIGESLDGDERTWIVVLCDLSKACECCVVAIAHI